MFIRKKGFILQPIMLSDAQKYLECHQDKEAIANFSSIPKNVSEAKKELKNAKNKFAILVDKEFAGFIKLELNNHPRYKHQAIVGYGIHKDYRGRGLATQALKAITAYAFKNLKLKRVYGMCRTHNQASIKVLQKAGYTHEGTLKKNKYVNGKYLDDMIWAKVK